MLYCHFYRAEKSKKSSWFSFFLCAPISIITKTYCFLACFKFLFFTCICWFLLQFYSYDDDDYGWNSTHRLFIQVKFLSRYETLKTCVDRLCWMNVMLNYTWKSFVNTKQYFFSFQLFYNCDICDDMLKGRVNTTTIFNHFFYLFNIRE